MELWETVISSILTAVLLALMPTIWQLVTGGGLVNPLGGQS